MSSTALELAVVSEAEAAFCEALLAGVAARQAWLQSGMRGDPDVEEGAIQAVGLPADALPDTWKTTALEALLETPRVRAYLTVRRAEIRARTNITPERVINEIANIAFLDPADVVTENVRSPTDIAKLPEHVRRAIVGWKWDREGNFVIEFASKQSALDALAKHFGLNQKDRENEKDATAKLMGSVVWRYVMALHLHEGVSIGEAQQRATADPAAVQKWGREVGLLKPGTDGEIVVE